MPSWFWAELTRFPQNGILSAINLSKHNLIFSSLRDFQFDSLSVYIYTWTLSCLCFHFTTEYYNVTEIVCVYTWHSTVVIPPAFMLRGI